MTTLIRCGEPSLHKILPTDEANFALDGVFNAHVNHIWAGNIYYAVWDCVLRPFYCQYLGCRVGKFVVGNYFPADQRQHNFLEQFF
jgi:hypothetical protein